MALNRCAIFILLLIAFSYCQPKETPDANLDVSGIWYIAITSMGNPETEFVQDIKFNQDGTYEQAFKVVNLETEEILEYYTLVIGNYQVLGNRLYRTQVKEYGRINTSGPYGREDLILKNSSLEKPLVLLSIDGSGDILTLDHRQGECQNPTGNFCADVQIYQRKK